MRVEMESGSEKSCMVGLSPNTVLPSQQNPRKKSSRRDELLTLKGDFREISFSRYRSISCKNAPTARVSRDTDGDLRRGSVYQSSKEARRMKEMGAIEERSKIEISRNGGIGFSIVDSLCSEDEENRRRRSQKVSTSSSSLPPRSAKPRSSDGFFEICLDPGKRGSSSAETASLGFTNANLRSDPVVVRRSNGNELLDRDAAKALPKSVSVKVAKPPLPSLSETDCLRPRSSPSKMYDPFKKSKSSRSPKPGDVNAPGLTNTRKNKTFSKSLSDFSVKPEDSNSESTVVKSKNRSLLSSSPVHLHGYLKLENKNGLPFFEFSLQCPEEVFVAKTWKAKDSSNWVYTFHAMDGAKKSNASRSGLHETDRDSSMVGQMQVSCYLCSELKDGVFDNSMVTEFVLYDILHAKLSDNAKPSNPNPGSDDIKPQKKSISNKTELHSSNSNPWAATDLNQSLEIAAVVLQSPFEKRESLKHKRGDKIPEKGHKSLLNLPMIERTKRDTADDSRSSLDKVKVIIPAGNHGFPSSKDRSPSSLLDRWRAGGGCDCGGWDMSCPLTVLGNPHFRGAKCRSLVENQIPMELFVQGAKDDEPALTMTAIEEGLYSVNFHAQLSTLQAFSVCVTILHGTETSADSGAGRDVNLPLGNSLKVMIEEEVKFLIESVTDEKESVTKRVKEIPPSYALKPPFSPIARV